MNAKFIGAFQIRRQYGIEQQLGKERKKSSKESVSCCSLDRYFLFGDRICLIGETEITVPLGSAYIYAEHGAKIISLGRDISSDVIIDSELTADENGNYPIDTSVERTYVITYTIDDIRYSGVKKIRTITVTGGQ